MPDNTASVQVNAPMDELLRDAGASNGENPLDQGRGLFSAACARLGLDARAVETGTIPHSSDVELLEDELLALVGAEDA